MFRNNPFQVLHVTSDFMRLNIFIRDQIHFNYYLILTCFFNKTAANRQPNGPASLTAFNKFGIASKFSTNIAQFLYRHVCRFPQLLLQWNFHSLRLFLQQPRVGGSALRRFDAVVFQAADNIGGHVRLSPHLTLTALPTTPTTELTFHGTSPTAAVY